MKHHTKYSDLHTNECEFPAAVTYEEGQLYYVPTGKFLTVWQIDSATEPLTFIKEKFIILESVDPFIVVKNCPQTILIVSGDVTGWVAKNRTTTILVKKYPLTKAL